MHRILLNFKLPYFLKAIFGVFPLGLGIIFGIVGLAFLFFGPKWILKEDEHSAMKKTASKKEEYTGKQKMWLRFTFWIGIIFIVIGIGSVGVTLLDNSDLEETLRILLEVEEKINTLTKTKSDVVKILSGDLSEKMAAALKDLGKKSDLIEAEILKLGDKKES